MIQLAFFNYCPPLVCVMLILYITVICISNVTLGGANLVTKNVSNVLVSQCACTHANENFHLINHTTKRLIPLKDVVKLRKLYIMPIF